VVQTVVLALTRDFQDRLARDLSLAVGLQPEDAPSRYRVRVDTKWLWRKARRRLRGVLTVSQGVLALAPVLIVGGSIIGFGRIESVVVFVVSAYWWVVFTAARSARAWVGEEDPRPGTPVAWVVDLYSRLPGLKWFARASTWATKDMAAPSRAVERDFAAFAGLGVARLVATIPVVRIALRTAVVVAAAEVLEQAQPQVVLGPTEPVEAPPRPLEVPAPNELPPVEAPPLEVPQPAEATPPAEAPPPVEAPPPLEVPPPAGRRVSAD
jgi:hypothetical protein